MYAFPSGRSRCWSSGRCRERSSRSRDCGRARAAAEELDRQGATKTTMIGLAEWTGLEAAHHLDRLRGAGSGKNSVTTRCRFPRPNCSRRPYCPQSSPRRRESPTSSHIHPSFTQKTYKGATLAARPPARRPASTASKAPPRPPPRPPSRQIQAVSIVPATARRPTQSSRWRLPRATFY